ncbi:MAG: TIGR04086 family membrane protein [bacterium]|nr:TIGR04086 family membrane protein [bacterium]
MDLIKNYLKSIGICIGIWLVGAFILNLFNYFDLLSSNIYKTFILITLALGIGISSFKLGKTKEKKGYIEGLRYGGIICLIMFLFSFLAFDLSFGLRNVIYFLIVIIVSMTCSILGINKKGK